MKRDYAMDYFKGLLVIGMIYTHVLQFFSDVSIYPNTRFSMEFFNLVTFSGFIFCFGYVNELAYYRKSFSKVRVKLLVTGMKTLLAFYISGLAFQVYVDDMSLDIATILPIILLQVIPGWSEFLLSFSLIMLMGLVLFPFINWIKGKPLLLWALVFLFLMTSFIDYSLIQSSYLGLFIGTELFPVFPVVQYLPFYLIGIYFANYKIVFIWKYFIGSILGTALFFYYLIRNDFQLPMRFPPSIYWLVGSAFFLYMYYLLCKFLERQKIEFIFLKVMGQNTLFYLVISNVFIFSLDDTLSGMILGPWIGLLFSVILLFIIGFLISIVSSRKLYT
ncbi:acyltransferase family protein [Saliterribacillus persicus]|uniref:Acyltransferase 3 domain-containing protein n=1 Tax=Saliterribacillus persicus TaxID=930114 RepID=A0A368YCE7_9BACI|nr:acyltransferase family protein [Saliterribacillus persicus]RCW77349.1 hypothetical protein DFR57_101220 [Saliterribacillus persicus]